MILRSLNLTVLRFSGDQSSWRRKPEKLHHFIPEKYWRHAQEKKALEPHMVEGRIALFMVELQGFFSGYWFSDMLVPLFKGFQSRASQKNGDDRLVLLEIDSSKIPGNLLKVRDLSAYYKSVITWDKAGRPREGSVYDNYKKAGTEIPLVGQDELEIDENALEFIVNTELPVSIAKEVGALSLKELDTTSPESIRAAIELLMKKN